MPKTSAPTKTKTPRRTSVLTEKQSAYVEARLDGLGKNEAAVRAGYAHPTSGSMAEQSEDVQMALAAARSELSSVTQIKRVDVIEMLQEAYSYAKLLEEPASMIGAAREIGKMLGFYEPEKIKLELNTDQARMQRKFEVMTDEQLLEIVNGSAAVVEGEFQRVN